MKDNISTRYEKLIESLIDGDNKTAKEIFHNIMVAKGQKIYNDLVAEDIMDEESVDMDATDDMLRDIEHDETGTETGVDDNDFSNLGDDNDFANGLGDGEGDDDEFGDEFGSDDGVTGDGDDDFEDFDGSEGGEPDLEEVNDKVIDLEDALAELQAQFDRMVGDESEEGAEPDRDTPPEEGTVREYVEKVNVKTEKHNGNDKSPIIGGKNDMGGTVKNIAQGGEAKGPGKVSVGDMGAVDTRKAGKNAFTSKVKTGGPNTEKPANNASILKGRGRK